MPPQYDPGYLRSKSPRGEERTMHSTCKTIKQQRVHLLACINRRHSPAPYVLFPEALFYRHTSYE